MPVTNPGVIWWDGRKLIKMYLCSSVSNWAQEPVLFKEKGPQMQNVNIMEILGCKGGTSRIISHLGGCFGEKRQRRKTNCFTTKHSSNISCQIHMNSGHFKVKYCAVCQRQMPMTQNWILKHSTGGTDTSTVQNMIQNLVCELAEKKTGSESLKKSQLSFTARQ